MTHLSILLLLSFLLSATTCCANEESSFDLGRVHKVPWNMSELSSAPDVHEATDFKADKVKALFYSGVPWRGNPTRAFAWYGFPEDASGGPYPAMVLVHGGLGTAFESWVRLWNSRGYAAIAMDTCGCLPRPGQQGGWTKDERGGPPGWGCFEQADLPPAEQWPYHAVADVILAHSLIRSFPEVDSSRIGITGISWGGVLTCIAAGVDHRFKCAVPIYGCGFLGEDSAWVDVLRNEKGNQWLQLWDPSRYLPTAKMPMLWVTGTNDTCFPLGVLRKSYLLPRGPHSLAVRIGMVHGQPQGESPEEIFTFADSILRSKTPLAKITKQRREGNSFYLCYHSQLSIVRAELNFTRDDGPWRDRKWETQEASIDSSHRKISATIPQNATAYFVNLYDADGRVTSSEHLEDNTKEQGQSRE